MAQVECADALGEQVEHFAVTLLDLRFVGGCAVELGVH
jgi:hypothetical protein